MPGSPRKRRGESPQTGAKPGATLWSARGAERPLRRVNQGARGGIDDGSKTARHGRRSLQRPERSLCLLAGLKPGHYNGWRDELAATKDGERFLTSAGRPFIGSEGEEKVGLLRSE